jgi:flagellar protein FlbD
MNGEEFVLNSSHIEIMEERPDTVITLTNDRKYIVREKIEEIITLIGEYQYRMLHRDWKSGGEGRG